jgi:hypothetical protein
LGIKINTGIQPFFSHFHQVIMN